jgi:hypothetical protein
LYSYDVFIELVPLYQTQLLENMASQPSLIDVQYGVGTMSDAKISTGWYHVEDTYQIKISAGWKLPILSGTYSLDFRKGLLSVLTTVLKAHGKYSMESKNLYMSEDGVNWTPLQATASHPRYVLVLQRS